MDSSTGEYNKKMRWLDYIINIPWSIYVKPKVTLKSSVKEKQKYLINIKKKLDEATYGQSVAKSEILQYMAREIISEGSGRILALHGDFGVGKTSLIRDGVAKALGRPFNFIAQVVQRIQYFWTVQSMYMKVHHLVRLYETL